MRNFGADISVPVIAEKAFGAAHYDVADYSNTEYSNTEYSNTEYSNTEYSNTEYSVADVIDLRDPHVADGLASMLDQVSTYSERAGAAEARAEIARHERLTATGRVRTLTDDLEQERAARHRLEIDNGELRAENQVRLEQIDHLQVDLHRTRDELQHVRSTMDELANATDELIEWLQGELARTKRAKHVLEALVSRRKLRDYDRLVNNETPSQPS